MTSSTTRRCPLCGDARLRPLPRHAAVIRSAFPGSELARCDACGLAFLSPIPSTTELLTIYEGDYFRAYETADIAMPAESDTVRRYQARLVKTDAHGQPPRVLDIGVGHGGFLNLAKEEGWEAMGVDVSGHAAIEAKARYGVEVIQGTLESARFASGHFDLVHLSHVLEHIPDPAATLREIRRILAPRGRVVIEVPNELENLQVRVFDALRIPRRRYPVPSTHLYFFTPRTLAAIMSSAGFDPDRVTTFRDSSDRSPRRRLAKRVAGILERPFGSAPLIEAVARRQR